MVRKVNDVIKEFNLDDTDTMRAFIKGQMDELVSNEEKFKYKTVFTRG